MKRKFVFFALWALMAGIWLVYLLGASARLAPTPFHEDEAIYAAWSWRILRGDFWLWETPVDKPPLTFYPMALSIALFGRHEWVARLPNLFWMLLLLASLWRIAKQRGASGWFAVGLTALSPLTWTYAASAFTDVAMVALTFLALERRLAGQAAQAGMAFGLALLAKPTAILLAPLVFVVPTGRYPFAAGQEKKMEACSSSLEKSRSGPQETPYVVTTLSRLKWIPPTGHDITTSVVISCPVGTTSFTTTTFIMACAAPLLMAWAWDASRAAPSWWLLGAQAYGTLGSLSVDLITWARLLLIGLGPVFALGGFLRWQEMGHWADRESTIQLALALTLLLWLPAHILLGFQPWERYLLPLVPIAALFLTTNDRARISRKEMMKGKDALHANHLPFSTNPCSTFRIFSPNPCSTFRLIDVAFWLSLLLIPALIVPFDLEPHDGRWEGIAEIGATIEELPPEAIVYYLDVGRPLAWYAADAQAKLQWVGRSHLPRKEEWEGLPVLLAQSPSSPHYVILRSTVPLPTELADWSLIKENSGFRLLAE